MLKIGQIESFGRFNKQVVSTDLGESMDGSRARTHTRIRRESTNKAQNQQMMANIILLIVWNCVHSSVLTF